jgi:hypothetical protein
MSKHSRNRARGDPKRCKARGDPKQCKARGNAERCESSIGCKRSIGRRDKSSNALIERSNGFGQTDVPCPPTMCQQTHCEAPPEIVVPNPGNGFQNGNGQSVQRALPPQESRNTFAVAQGMIFTSTIHFSGASFTIGSHFAQHGIAVATELEMVGLAMLGLSAALSGITLFTAFKMMPWGNSGSK